MLDRFSYTILVNSCVWLGLWEPTKIDSTNMIDQRKGSMGLAVFVKHFTNAMLCFVLY